jgi:hypothetical protein
MARLLDKGIELIQEVPGRAAKAAKGLQIVYNARLYLRRGEDVTYDPRSIALYRDHLPIRQVDGVELIDHTTILGKRHPIACIEKSLYGMQAGGFREILASPHLCYGEEGIDGLIPPNAMLRAQIWVRNVRTADVR